MSSFFSNIIDTLKVMFINNPNPTYRGFYIYCYKGSWEYTQIDATFPIKGSCSSHEECMAEIDALYNDNL